MVFKAVALTTFYYFALAAVIFSIVYLLSYNAFKSNNSTTQNIYRTASLYYQAGADVITSTGLKALATTNKTFKFYFLGLGGFVPPVGYTGQGCVKDTFLFSPSTTFTFQGCHLPSTSQSCIQTQNYEIYPHPQDPYTCVLQLDLPKGVTLDPQALLSFQIPSYYSFQALNISFSYEGIDQVSLSNTDDEASVREGSFFEVITYPTQQLGQYLGSTIQRSWVLSPIIFRYQDNNTCCTTFDSIYYAQVVSSSAPTLPVQTARNFLYFDPAPSITISLALSLSDTYLVQLSQRLVASSEIVLTVVLAIIGIYHLVEFAQEILEFVVGATLGAIFSLEDKKKAKRGNAINNLHDGPKMHHKSAPGEMAEVEMISESVAAVAVIKENQLIRRSNSKPEGMTLGVAAVVPEFTTVSLPPEAANAHSMAVPVGGHHASRSSQNVVRIHSQESPLHLHVRNASDHESKLPTPQAASTD